MQAIILAAGNGTRLGKLTRDVPKCMVKVNGVTMIERMLGTLDKHNLSRIVIVTGYEGELLKTFVQELDIKTEIVFVYNDVYNTTNNIFSLYKAKEYLLLEDTLLLESDLIFDPSIIGKILSAKYDSLALVAKHEPWMDGTVLTIDDQDNIKSFISKKDFDYSKVNQYYKTVNIYKFSKEFSSSHYVPFLEAYCKAMGNNEYYEQVLKVIAYLDEPVLKALPLDGETWYEVDDVNDLEIAEVLFAGDKKSKFTKIMSKYGGYWRYPGLKDFCYLVNPFYPNTMLMDEMINNFERLLRDYPSGLNVNTSLVAKYFFTDPDCIVVGNGASELIKSLMTQIEGNMGIITPTFEEYPNRLTEDKRVIFDSSLIDYRYDAKDLIEFYNDKDIDTLLLINPDNPSGNYIIKEEALELVQWASKKNITVVLDESFIDFMNLESDGTLLEQEILEQYPNLIVIKSISKSHGVPGVRLGILASSDRELVSKIKKDVSIWNINSFGEFYMQIAAKYKKEFSKALTQFYDVRKDMSDKLSEIKRIKVYPSQANYIMFELLDDIQSLNVCETILDSYNILIKDLSPKQGFEKQYIRVAVKTPEENNELVNALNLILSDEHVS